MTTTNQVLLVLVTAPDRRTGRRLAKLALDAHLVACASLLPGLESHYWWQGKLERSAEVLLFFKTTRHCRPALERLIMEEHPYDTPEFVVVPIRYANSRYLAWWLNSCR